ncbi:MAG TPA: gephyrin-like molybdotransferase Glp [Pyrinomonadaceae bacterium]|jgi:molybdenum cofactor synthesis domain-containing protein|nr:gephyrin-like molybdotransferase Glp [Pyrinomonadaceae bacterium]
MIPISEAIKIIKLEIAPLKAEKISLAEASGRVLAEDIVSDTDLPPFDRSQMDGFAVLAADTKKTPVTLTLVGESAAGAGWHRTLKPGQAVRIMTGAPVPRGADAVQKLELANDNGRSVEILGPVEPGNFIVHKAAEIKKGETLFKRGETLNSGMLAALASFGYARVRVARRPRIGILVTGSEIVPVSAKPKRDQIRDSNSTLLRAYAEKCGAEVTTLSPVGDDPGRLKKVIAAATRAAKNFDLLVISGGVSVGKYDFTKRVLQGLGAEVFFEKLSLKPGKPMVFAKVGKTPVFGLPGNPVSVAVTFHLFVRTALMLMQAAAEPELARGNAVVISKIKAAKERDSMLPVRVETDAKGRMVIESLRFTGSSNFVAFARANALVFVPQAKDLKNGDIAEIRFL